MNHFSTSGTSHLHQNSIQSNTSWKKLSFPKVKLDANLIKTFSKAAEEARAPQAREL